MMTRRGGEISLLSAYRTRTVSAESPLVWQHHEGHPGWTIEQVASISAGWIKLQPDVITMHLGTNDCRKPAAAAIVALKALLKTIGAALPKAKVFVASILRMPASHAAFVTGLNAAIPAMASAAGSNCHYVPLYENTTLVCGDNKQEYSIGDGVHPNPFGHLRVGGVFARTMAAALCPSHASDRSC